VAAEVHWDVPLNGRDVYQHINNENFICFIFIVFKYYIFAVYAGGIIQKPPKFIGLMSKVYSCFFSVQAAVNLTFT